MHLRGFKRMWRAAYVRRYTRKFMASHPHTTFVRDADAYLAELSARDMVVTGRFHAVCLAILTRTPFVAVKSNSWKIETLLRDIGLNPGRVRALDTIQPDQINAQDWAFTPDEMQQIDAALLRWRKDSAEAFDQIAQLV
jgi:polysaccharide pyruvyl transferase WcaK-like protein